MIKQVKLYSVLLLAAVGLMLVAACGATPATAQDGNTTSHPRTISVAGTGVAYGSPDVANAQIGVQTRSTDPDQALTDNSAKMDALIAALKGMGVAEKDIQTTNFSVFAQPDYNPQTGEQLETITYVVENTVSVTVRDIGRLGDVLTGAVEAGANSIYGVSFSVNDETALEAQAREKAMADARARAEALARLAGVTLDTPLSISENFSGGPIPMPFERMAAADMAAGSVPVQTGQIQVNMQVNVVYTIK